MSYKVVLVFQDFSFQPVKKEIQTGTRRHVQKTQPSSFRGRRGGF